MCSSPQLNNVGWSNGKKVGPSLSDLTRLPLALSEQKKCKFGRAPFQRPPLSVERLRWRAKFRLNYPFLINFVKPNDGWPGAAA